MKKITKEFTETKKNWIDEMIERQATPEPLREGTTAEFCKKWGIPESNYYYHAAKPENEKKILNISLRLAKNYTPEVLKNLGERAKGDNKAAELFLDYVLELRKKVDMTSGGKPIPLLGYVRNHVSNQEDNADEGKD